MVTLDEIIFDLNKKLKPDKQIVMPDKNKIVIQKPKIDNTYKRRSWLEKNDEMKE